MRKIDINKLIILPMIAVCSACSVVPSQSGNDTFKGSEFKVLAAPQSMTNEEAIEFIRRNGDYKIFLASGDLIESLETINSEMNLKTVIYRENSEKDFSGIKDAHPLPTCLTFDIASDYSVSSNDYIKTINEILDPQKLRATLYANETVLISSTTKYENNFCQGNRS